MSVTRVKQSAVIPVAPSAFWSSLCKLDFKWWNLVAASEFVSGAAGQVNSVVKLTFADKATWTLRVVGISELRKTIEFELLETNPSAGCSSALHELAVHEVTLTGESFFVWTADYSSDASAELIQDSKFKRVEAFRHLIAASAGAAAVAH